MPDASGRIPTDPTRKLSDISVSKVTIENDLVGFDFTFSFCLNFRTCTFTGREPNTVENKPN
jgi:hypothetical protein